MNILKQISSIVQKSIDILIWSIKHTQFLDLLLPFVYLFLVYSADRKFENM